MSWHQTPSLPFLLRHHTRGGGDEDVASVKPASGAQVEKRERKRRENSGTRTQSNNEKTAKQQAALIKNLLSVALSPLKEHPESVVLAEQVIV